MAALSSLVTQDLLLGYITTVFSRITLKRLCKMKLSQLDCLCHHRRHETAASQCTPSMLEVRQCCPLSTASKFSIMIHSPEYRFVHRHEEDTVVEGITKCRYWYRFVRSAYCTIADANGSFPLYSGLDYCRPLYSSVGHYSIQTILLVCCQSFPQITFIEIPENEFRCVRA